MAGPIPTPFAALVGIVPAVTERVRRLPAKALTLPVIALGTVLTKAENARRDYDSLAERGSAVLARLRGTASDAVAEFAGDVAARADHLEDRVEKLTGRAVPDVPPAERPKVTVTPPSATKKATTPASPANALAAELIAEATPTSDLDHDALPLADFDNLTLGSLRGRLRSLTSDELVQVRSYEKAHAARLPFLTMLDNRIAKLAADAGAASTGGSVTGPSAAGPAPKGGSKVSRREASGA